MWQCVSVTGSKTSYCLKQYCFSIFLHSHYAITITQSKRACNVHPLLLEAFCMLTLVCWFMSELLICIDKLEDC